MFNSYKDKKVFITGHTGFKGSWLTLWLLKLGAIVSGYALDPKTNKDIFVLCELNKKIYDIRDDIRNYFSLKEYIDKFEPEIIFHLAAQPLVLESYDEPKYTFETNTLGTLNILEAFRQSRTAKILVVITSDKVYENNEWIWGYRENDKIGGDDPYSASKSAAEIIVNAYQKSFFYKQNNKLVATVRAGNVIGGGDWSKNRIVPDCIRALENKETIIIRNPMATRPWQHVLEPIGGYLLLAEKLMQGETFLQGAWNFGPNYNNNKNVELLVKEIIKQYGEGTYKIENEIDKPKEAKYLALDITKAIKILNWEPIFNFEETIKLTIDWYKKYKSENVFDLSLLQIEEYEKRWKLKNLN
ncbi:MAG: CDP-glucose 4,6-dehydratase [Ignavibacteria bacterium]|nr:CDP-glucose 4,6-dehydratase [Ignavibacteria bacterium]